MFSLSPALTRRRVRRSTAIVLLAAISGVSSTPTTAQEVSYAGSFSYSTGSYVFTERTHSLWLSNTLDVRARRLGVSATLPIITQNSGVVSFVAGQPLPTGGERSGAVSGRRRGDRIGSGSGAGSGSGSSTSDTTVVFRNTFEVEVGDPLMSASLELYSGFGWVRSISIRGSAKAPLRSLESGVGTGAWDFGGGGSLVLGRGKALVLGDVSYWSFGDLPELELNGSVLYSVGLSRSVMGARGSVMLSLAGATSVVDTVDPPLSAGVGFLYMPKDKRTVSLGTSLGLSEASPDFSAWLGWSLGL